MERMSASEFRKQAGVKAPVKSRPAPPDMRALGRLPKGDMNKTEARFAELLDADPDVVWWRFEAVKLMLAPNTSITIDFFLMRADRSLEAVDVKGARGMVTDDGWAKLKIAASLFPWTFKVAIPKPSKAGGGWSIEEVGR